MEEQKITFETAKLASEKGFPQHGYSCYRNDSRITNYSQQAHGYLLAQENQENNYFSDFECIAPTQSLLQKWLREIHNCFIDILPHRDGDSKNKQWKNKEDVFWTVEVDYYGKNFEIKLTNNADFTQHFNKSYEEALEIGLQEALKLIK